MPLTSLLLNILWIVFGGAWMALGWLIASLIMAITIIGVPWARAAFNIRDVAPVQMCTPSEFLLSNPQMLTA